MLSCSEFNDSLPPGLIVLDSGIVTPSQNSIKMVGTGAQQCFVELVNGTVHITPYQIRHYSLGPEGETDIYVFPQAL